MDFKAACGNSHDDTVNKTLNSALKLICDHKTTDEWIELLTDVEKVNVTHLHAHTYKKDECYHKVFSANPIKYLQEIEASIFSEKSKQQSKILASMAKCQYNKHKGQVSIQWLCVCVCCWRITFHIK